ncbi:MAG TPA: ferrous iron transport protein B [bacterium]|nr:ferrous iron transport protein B [bacterium]HQI49819.1 ferrous iron transport protein B [bacterium]HQJ64734.1 ferrous iron transport protein B [bacterium]
MNRNTLETQSALILEHPRIILLGQPNSGKSTIFNKVAGYRSITTNFPGVTVEYTSSHVAIGGRTCDLIDLPGIYSLTAIERAARETLHYLIEEPVSLIINVIDATHLDRSLELTLQLLELGKPMLLCLNMIDEAERKGIRIDAGVLSSLLKLPVITTNAAQGLRIDALFDAAFDLLHAPHPVHSLPMSRHVEQVVEALDGVLKRCLPLQRISSRLLAIKLLESDPFFALQLEPDGTHLRTEVRHYQSILEEAHGQPADSVISAERHALSLHLFEQCTVVHHPRRSWHQWRSRVDQLVMHPVWGYVIMATVLVLFFNLIFKLGALLEQPILTLFTRSEEALTAALPTGSFYAYIAKGLLQGIAGGIAVVLPYLIPFLIGMALIEDVGYLPRIAFLMDNFMHRIGLHGTAVLPGILGYGCSVPAIMATRILPSPRDRFIAAVAAVLVPCSARMTIIFGLVGYYLGGTAALFIYLLNIVVVALVGTLLAHLMPDDTPGMVLVIPSYKVPSLKTILAKTWLRSRDFVLFAWPLLIAGSLVLSLSEVYHWNRAINSALAPLLYVLGLPPAIGMTLIFGVLRKELSMIMLIQALGTTQVNTVMSPEQILVFTIFVVFYFPCLATFGILTREVGWKEALAASLLTFSIAVVLGVVVRFIAPWLLQVI